MSATRDKSQPNKYVHSNLYRIHANRKETRAVVLKTRSPGAPEDHREKTRSQIEIRAYEPAELKAPPAVKPKVQPAKRARAVIEPPRENAVVESLKSNMNRLNDLHSRLNFMLKELEDLISS